jgi:hypothetical protein
MSHNSPSSGMAAEPFSHHQLHLHPERSNDALISARQPRGRLLRRPVGFNLRSTPQGSESSSTVTIVDDWRAQVHHQAGRSADSESDETDEHSLQILRPTKGGISLVLCPDSRRHFLSSTCKPPYKLLSLVSTIRSWAALTKKDAFQTMHHTLKGGEGLGGLDPFSSTNPLFRSIHG